jgi:hypothetical protein
MPRRALSSHTQAAIVASLIMGESVHEVSRMTGVGRRTVRRWRDAPDGVYQRTISELQRSLFGGLSDATPTARS